MTKVGKREENGKPAWGPMERVRSWRPQIIEKEGRKEFVVLPYEEFLQIQEALDDFKDLRELRKERTESKDAAGRNLRQSGKEAWF